MKFYILLAFIISACNQEYHVNMRKPLKGEVYTNDVEVAGNPVVDTPEEPETEPEPEPETEPEPDIPEDEDPKSDPDEDLEPCTSTDVKFSEDTCLLYTSPSPRDATLSRMPSSA